MTGGTLSDWLPLRLILFGAAVVCAGGYIAAAFAPNFIILLVGCGFLSGFGAGLMTSTPPSTLVTLFKKKRHLAIGIYFSFCSIGSTVMPLLYGLLITYIKVKGMLLVIAGMWLLLFIVGIIIHPKKIKEIKNLLQSKNIVNTNVTKSNIKEMPLKMSQYGDVRVLGENENSNVNNNKINTDAGEINKGFLVEVENVSLKGDVGQDIMHQKTDSMKHIPKDTAAGKERNSVPNERKMKQIKQVLSNGRFWLILFIVSFSQMGNFSALYLLPSFAKEKGQSLTGITLVVSTFGICDLIGRFVFGYLGDKKAFNRFTILTCCQIVAGGGVLVLTFFDLNFIPFLISVILGLGGGIHVVYTAPLVADIVPSKIAGTASGIAFMSMFLCTAAIQTPAGMLQAASGTYASGIQMACGFYLLAALFTAPLGMAFIYNKCTLK